MSNWTAAEIREMLSITAERIIKNQLTGTVKDGVLYEKVAKELGQRSFRREKKQVISKLKNLRKKFNDVCDHNNQSGRGRLDWEHSEVCHAILGSSHTANPQHVQGSLDNTLADSPISNTPENVETGADEERDDAGSQSGESQTGKCF
uniref:Myb/SANT-like DNA-binding domain-containing protein n=1 Tax=Sparus aurata TaxID=8175 RepID=A0A671VN51_SPAAU